MNLDQIRTELVAQHEHLRGLIDGVRGRVPPPPGSVLTGGELRARIDELAVRLREHNRREEELLGGILATIDAWGTVREEIMNEQHVAEHRELAVVLDAAAAAETTVASETFHATLDRVLEHMAREEKMFLNEALLREDGVIHEQFSG